VRKLAGVLALAPLALACLSTSGSTAVHAFGLSGGGTPPLPSTAGYAKSYFRNFTGTNGLGNWNDSGPPPPGAGQTGSAAYKVSKEKGLGITLTKNNDSIGMWSSSTSFAPGSGVIIQGDVYLPASKGEIVNWPAFWSVGAADPADGEIDLVEGLGGAACWHTHQNPDTGPGGCAPVGQFTGWATFTALWKGGQVEFWYNSTYMGTEPLATTETQTLRFGSTTPGAVASYGGSWYGGPPLYPSTTWLKAVVVYTK
jgi:hypothetical protein